MMRMLCSVVDVVAADDDVGGAVLGVYALLTAVVDVVVGHHYVVAVRDGEVLLAPAHAGAVHFVTVDDDIVAPPDADAGAAGVAGVVLLDEEMA